MSAEWDEYCSEHARPFSSFWILLTLSGLGLLGLVVYLGAIWYV